MGWRRIFRGRRLRRSMRSCTRPREPLEAQDRPLADCPPPHKVPERPLRVRENPRKTWGRKLQKRPQRGQGKPLKARGEPLEDRGRPEETKSLLEHLIKSNKEREAAARLTSR